MSWPGAEWGLSAGSSAAIRWRSPSCGQGTRAAGAGLRTELPLRQHSPTRPAPPRPALAWVTSPSVPSGLPSGPGRALGMRLLQRAPGAVPLWLGFGESPAWAGTEEAAI